MTSDKEEQEYKEYLAPHLRKDVPTCNAVVIALSAVISAVCGGTAAILTAQLSHSMNCGDGVYRFGKGSLRFKEFLLIIELSLFC